MHREIVKKVYFFQDKPPHFIAFIGPLLKPIHIEEDTYIYQDNDPIEEIFFLIKGKAAFVHKDLKDAPYLMVDSGYYFGEIDFVFHVILFLLSPISYRITMANENLQLRLWKTAIYWRFQRLS